MDLLAEIEGIKGFSVLALDWVAEDDVPTLPIEYDEPLGNEYQKAANFKSPYEASGKPLQYRLAHCTSCLECWSEQARR